MRVAGGQEGVFLGHDGRGAENDSTIVVVVGQRGQFGGVGGSVDESVVAEKGGTESLQEVDVVGEIDVFEVDFFLLAFALPIAQLHQDECPFFDAMGSFEFPHEASSENTEHVAPVFQDDGAHASSQQFDDLRVGFRLVHGRARFFPARGGVRGEILARIVFVLAAARIFHHDVNKKINNK